jgi:hypothetical protein
MNRRSDTWTAEKVDMGLLTRAAFNMDAAVRYAELAGLRRDFILEVLARPADRVRQYHSSYLGTGDRRASPRL